MNRQTLSFVALLLLLVPISARAQFGPPQPAGPPKPPRESAPIDLTGYWVSVVTEDWRWRMVTPLKGDAASVPITPAARVLIDAWNPARDEAAGLQCKAYGAPAIMRVSGRLHISWQDDNTLRIDADAGQQTRLFHFGTPPRASATSWQGVSTARWEGPLSSGFPGIPFLQGQRLGARSRSLEVETVQLRAGYLRKNGVPYSEKTALKEYYDLFSEPAGDTWFMVTTVVEDPVYLATPFVTTSHFKKQPDGSGWHPEPCTAR